MKEPEIPSKQSGIEENTGNNLTSLENEYEYEDEQYYEEDEVNEEDIRIVNG